MMIVDDPSQYGQWLPFSWDPVARKLVEICEHKDGRIEKRERKDVTELCEVNKALFNDSADKRWGDGKVIASIDLQTYYDKIVPAKQSGDDAWIKRWLNDSDNRAYRTFKGHV